MLKFGVVRYPLGRRFAKVNGGVHPHVRACTVTPLFGISGAAGRIALKLSVCLGVISSAFYASDRWGTSTCEHVSSKHPFFLGNG